MSGPEPKTVWIEKYRYQGPVFDHGGIGCITKTNQYPGGVLQSDVCGSWSLRLLDIFRATGP